MLTLEDWLKHIESLHPKSIAMGLDRVNEVKQRLLLDLDFPVITVAGTNGKGSSCAMLERIYLDAGYSVGCYTSPHLLHYNERVRINGLEANDAALCSAFAAVEQARENTELTYFESGTLAAIWLFKKMQLDIAILEVGLGGRLDAVNAFEPSCTIVTSVALDHMEFLGNSRESIGFEKAGIFRKGVPAICGDANPPATLVTHAQAIGADFQLIQQYFGFYSTDESWTYREETPQKLPTEIADLPFPALKGDFQLHNAACVIAAIQALQTRLPVNHSQMVSGLKAVNIAGRFQRVDSHPQIILDVAHNPHAALALVENLRHLPCSGRTLAVFAMLADKDIAGVIHAVKSQINAWYVADIDHARGAKASQLVDSICQQIPDCTVAGFSNVILAFRQAYKEAAENDRIIVFGSFFTVADIMRVLGGQSAKQALNLG
ncbi:MAG: bifunctional tetrahydrofolate synthase/dihydrofolate synthase [Methylophilaceae bacterium]|nr:bifunctional tetrahydrofolate synthase/dihydrofolate synthase [Methylophilaceae bacterium]